MFSRALRAAGLLLIMAFAIGLHYIGGVAPVAAGFSAKVMCSGVFVSHREPESILAEDLAFDHPFRRFLEVRVDYPGRRVTATFAGLFERRAIYRDGLGCTLLSKITEQNLLMQAEDFVASVPDSYPEFVPWPLGDLDVSDGLPRDIDQLRLALTIEDAFSEPDPARPRRTRAIVVVHDGRVIAERYAPGFDRDMPLTGWSMTKSILNALTGILVGEGRLVVSDPAPVPEWSGEVDPRHAITVENLLQMSSGLRFEEDYETLDADAPVMLFNSFSAGALAAGKRLEAAPGEKWKYSSGTSNILSRVIRGRIPGPLPDYWSFPRRALFDRIGMSSAVLEPDSSGVFVASSFSYATARDWARLGLLYLNDGVWQGERILPAGWVRYSTTPARHAAQGNYGAYIWLNAGNPPGSANRRWPELPADLYYFSGFEGQQVFIIPSKKLVAVRLGCSREPTTWDPGAFLRNLLAVIR